MQLTYDLPEAITQKLRMKNFSVFINGSRLVTLSKHKEQKDLLVGSEPYYRSFSLGVKTIF
jgi:hypothetical protein